MAEIVLDGTLVGDGYPPYTIGEAGSNHSGILAGAKKLIKLAKDFGAQAVKFQTRNNRELFTKAFFDSPYNSENALGPTYGLHREALEFGFEDYLKLSDYAKEVGITFFSTPFDEASVSFLETIGVPFYKVASASATNLKFVKHVAERGKPVLISLGGCTKAQIWRTVDLAAKVNTNLVLMHCVASYPCPVEYSNLGRIKWLKKEFPEFVIGFSDHQDSISLGGVAWELGARVFEKHITLSHSLPGTDHGFSLEGPGLQLYTKFINHALIANQDYDQPFDIEKSAIRKMAQAVYLKTDLSAGAIIKEADLVLKSPADGISAEFYYEIIGQRLKIDVQSEQPLDWDYFET